MEAQKVKSRRLSKNKYAVISADDSQDSLRVKSRRLGKSTKTNVSGLGYVGGKLGTGALGIVEGTADLLAGTAALLGGDKEYAEYLFMHDNWVSNLNAKLDEGYNPGKVMRFVGDTASGLGQSATFLIPGAGQVLFFTGVLGNGISSASQKTGKVGFREYGYGALSAALEFTLERFVSGSGQTLETLTRTGAKNIGSAVTKAVGKTAAKNTARKMVATQLISSAVGEGVEEFFGNVGDHFLQKLTGVDRESEFDFGAALYDFVVGMASGGLMGGVSTTVQTAYEKKNGAQINADEGRRERMLKQARVLVESAKKQNLDKGSDAVATYLSMLEAGLNTYDGAIGKSGAMAEGAVNLALGKINSALMSTEFNIITDRHAEHIASLSEAERAELAAYANDYFRDAGANVTAEDLLDINNEYTRALASLDWAGNVVRTMVGVNGRVNTEIAEVMQREMLSEDEAFAAKEKAAQREGFQKLRTEAEKRAVAIGDSETWRGGEAVYSYSLDGVSGYLKLMKEADGYKAVTISEKSASEVKLTEEEVKKFLAALRESKTAQKSKTESKEAEDEVPPSEEKKTAEGAKMTDEAAGGKAKGAIGDDSVPPRERTGSEKAADTYEEKEFAATTQEVKAAMKAVKVYKLLSADRRQAIIEMMRSAGGIDKVTVASIANIMSARDGLHVRFMKGHRAEGSHDVLKSGERLILLNPEKTEGKYWRRDILFHELWHDLSRDGGTKVLTEEIYRRSAPAFQHMVVDRYTKYYNGVSMSQFLDGKKWTEENVKAYFDTYTKISYDEVMEEVAAGTAGRVMGSKNFIKNFRDVSMLRRIFYGISDFCRAMVNKTYMTNGEETAGFMLSFKEALTFRRLYELAYTKERFHLDEGVLRAMEEIFMERDEGDSERAKTKKSLSLYEAYTEKYKKLDLNQDISTLDGVPAIRLMDGSILPFTEPHVTFIQNNGIDVEDIESGGWISGGVYEASERSDTMRYKERMLAKKRMDEKRAAKTKMSLNIVAANGETTIVDPAKVTRDKVFAYMKESLQGKLEKNTYFPVSPETPKTVIYTLQNAGIQIANLPLVMQAKKARKAQIVGDDYKKDGKLIRHHAMEAEEILEAIDKLDSPEAVIQETNRTKPVTIDGRKEFVDLQDTFSFFVTLENGDECVVVIEPYAEIDPKYLIEDDAGYEYHTTVTVFKPDIFRDGIPFDYIEYLLENGDNIEREIKKESPITEAAIIGNPNTALEKGLSDNSIPQPTPKVNSKKSLSLDNTGSQLTEEQEAYFKDSKVRDSQGRLLVMYQGAAEEFYTFDRKKSKPSNLYGRGFYFTNSADQARHYGTVRPYYLNIKNPLATQEKTISRLQMRKFLKAVSENEDYSIENYGTYDIDKVLKSVYEGKSDFAMLNDVSLTAIGDLVEAVELFNEINGTAYDGFILDTEAVTFKSNQAKLTSNTSPTVNPDTRYSLSLDSDSSPLSAAEVEGDANRVSWGFSWTDEKLLSNIRKVQKYFRERYPDHMVEFELDNRKKRVVIVEIRPMRDAKRSKAFTAPLAENDAYHEELAALFRSIGISDDRISEHISVFETEEEKSETIERAKQQNEGKRLKVYQKQEVAKSIEGVLSNVLSPIVGPSKLMGKKKRALITRLWQELNRAKASEREKLAERFAEELILSTVYDDYEVNAEYEQMLVDGTVESYETVEGYRGKLSATDVSGDLVARYGKKRANAIMRRWLAKEGGVAVGTALAEMQNEGILTDVTAKNDADLLIAINEEYERLKARTSMRRELLPLAAMSEERLSAIKSELKTSLLAFFTEGGKDTEYGKLARRYQELLAMKDQKMSEELQSIEKQLTDAFAARVEKLREETAKSREYWQKRASEARYGREYAREQNRVLADVRGLRDYLNRDYTAASEGEDRMTRNIAKAILKATGKIGVRADKAKIAAKIMLDWVNTVKQSNPEMVGDSYMSASLTQEEYDALVKVSSTSAQEGDSLTLEELQAFHRIVNAAKRIYHSYDKVWINGKWVNVEELAREAVSIIEGSYTEAKGIKGKLRDLVARATKTFLDPLAVAAHIDGYRTDGVITRLVTELALAEAEKNRMIIELRKPFEDFFKEHKKYAKTLAEKKIKLTDEFEITLGQAITLHEMFKRDQAKAGLMLSRIGFHMDDGTIKKLEGYGQSHFVSTPSGEKVSLERAREILRDRDHESVKAALKELGYDVEAYNGELAVKEFSDAFTVADSDAIKFMDQFGDQRKRLIEGLEKDFTDEDREFLKVVSHFFQETSKNAKKKADLQNIGYSNVIEGYYFPIKRMQGDMAKNIADGQVFAEFATTSNISFNQSTVEGAKASVEIFGIWDVVTDHINGLAMWEHLYLPVQNINKVWNKNVGKGTGNVVSVKNQLDGRGDGDFTKWMSDLLLDVQGARQKETKTWLDTALEKLRGGYAVFQLGANVQTIAKQTLSWVAATQYIDPLYMAQGVKNLRLNADKLNTYSAVAAERENDATVVRAFSNTEKVTKLAEKTMIGITAADRVVNMAIWSACQKQVAAENPSMPIGSEENLKRAGKLCDEVIMKVQDSSDMTTKSQAARSSSEFIKSLTMFQSAGLKMFSRLWEGVWRVTRYQKLAKSDAAYQKDFASAKKQLVRTVGAFAGVSVGTAVIVQLFKVLFNKEREDKEGNEISVLEDMALDTFGEAVGVIPVIGDLTDYFLNGYELSSYSYDMLNEMLTATKENMALLDKLVHGEVIEEWEIGRMIRKTTRSAGMLTGIPIRNVENFVTGWIRRFSKETGYAYDTLFYNANYTEDLNRAIAKGEDEFAEAILALMMKRDKTGSRVYSDEVLNTITTLHGEDYSVLPRTIDTDEVKTRKRLKTFEAVYQKADNAVEKLVSREEFKALAAYNTEEGSGQALAIKTLYTGYYQLAEHDVLGKELTRSAAYMTVTDPVNLMLVKAYDKAIKLEAVEMTGTRKAMLAAYMKTLGMDNTERAYAAYACGFRTDEVTSKILKDLKGRENEEELLIALGFKEKEEEKEDAA